MVFDALEELSINQLEYCFLAEDKIHTASTFKIHIPKLMPLVPMSGSSSPTGYNNMIFVNDGACKPSTSPMLTTQGYITLPRFMHTDFLFKADPLLIIRTGAKFICCIMDKNIRDIFLTHNV
jgi:hypothetical protein